MLRHLVVLEDVLEVVVVGEFGGHVAALGLLGAVGGSEGPGHVLHGLDALGTRGEESLHGRIGVKLLLLL